MLWSNTKPAAEVEQRASIKKLTDSATNRIFEVIHQNGGHIAK